MAYHQPQSHAVASAQNITLIPRQKHYYSMANHC